MTIRLKISQYIACIFQNLAATFLILSLLLSVSADLLPVLSSYELPQVSAHRDIAWMDIDTSDPLQLLRYHTRLTVGGRMTTTNSPFSENYDALLNGTGGWSSFHELSQILYPDDSYVIPGLNSTNLSGGGASGHMVPQGLCIADEYVLISAYNYTKKQKNSVIYVLDKNDRTYIMTLVLNLKSHVGALAYDSADGTVYIADSNAYDSHLPATQTTHGKSTIRYRVWKLAMNDIQRYIREGSDAVKIHMDQYLTTTVCPSFLCTYRDLLFVGDFNANPADNYISYMRGYSAKTGQPVVGRINLDRSTQGISLADYKGKTYLVSSNSFGRNAVSELKVRRIYASKNFGWHVSPLTSRRVIIPNMSEDIDIQDGHILINFESASSKYQENNNTQVQIDRVLNLSLAALIDRSTVASPELRTRTLAPLFSEADPLIAAGDLVLQPLEPTLPTNTFLGAALPVDNFDFHTDSKDDSERRSRLRKLPL